MALNSVQQKIVKGMLDEAVARTALKIAVYNNTDNFSRNQMPCAQMTYDSGDPRSIVNKQKKDMVMHQVWAIYGRNPDEVAFITEQLMFLFYVPAVRNDLEALGFVGYELTNLVPAQYMDEKDLSGGVQAIIEFDVRMEIVNPFLT